MKNLICFMAFCLVFYSQAFAMDYDRTPVLGAQEAECASVQCLAAQDGSLISPAQNISSNTQTTDETKASNDNLQLDEAEGIDSVDISNIQEQVNALLTKVLPGAKVVSMEEVRQNGVMVIKCKVSYGGFELLFNVDPKTGAISKFESNKGNFVTSHPEITTSMPGIKITQHQVNKILSEKIPGASVKKLKYNKKKGIVSGHCVYMGADYYFEIDAVRGNVTKFEPAN